MRVLVGIDGSESANVAIELAAEAPWATGTTIRVVEVVESGSGLFGGSWPALEFEQASRLEAELRVEAERSVSEARVRLSRPGLTIEPVVLCGRPAAAIVDEGRRIGSDLIMVGRRGHGTIESMLLGSVSSEVVDHATAPVLVVRGPRIERVLLAWDGSSCASHAADLLRTWPIFKGSQVRVVSVADIEVPWWTGFPNGTQDVLPVYVDAAEASRARHEQLAREMAAHLLDVGLRADWEQRGGDAATEILALANAWRADVIVMGTHGRSRLARLLLGSVARNVLHHASCSVLVAREESGPPDEEQQEEHPPDEG